MPSSIAIYSDVKPVQSEEEARIVDRMWMFNVGGAWANLLTGQAEECLLEVLAARIACGEPVTLNSSRSLSWIAEHVLPKIRARVEERSLQNLMIVGEKGGAWANFTSNGALQSAFDVSLRVPRLCHAALWEIVQTPEFFEAMTVDESMQTLTTVTMRNTVSLPAFKAIQAECVPIIQKCLAAYGLDTTWRVDATSNGIDVEHLHAGKDAGARKIIQWLYTQHIRPLRGVIAFGYSTSEIAMANEFLGHFPVEFVFLGEQNIDEKHSSSLSCA